MKSMLFAMLGMALVMTAFAVPGVSAQLFLGCGTGWMCTGDFSYSNNAIALGPDGSFATLDQAIALGSDGSFASVYRALALDAFGGFATHVTAISLGPWGPFPSPFVF